MEKQYDKILYGFHVGEHGFVEDKIMEELKEYAAHGINFVTVRPPSGRKIPAHYYLEWAKFMAEHQMHFIFLYAIQYPPKGERAHITPETVAKIKEIAGDYFLGDMLGETGSSYACKLPGYYGTGRQVMPAQDAADMQQAKDAYLATVEGFADTAKWLGLPHIASVEATMLNNYNMEVGVDLPFTETPCANPELVLSALRGAARAANAPLWGTYVAHEWYAGMRHFDELKRKRFEMVYKYCYLAGSQLFCLESGIAEIHSYGVKLPAENEIAKANSEVVYRLAEKMMADQRPAGGPHARVAFVQGNLDSFGGGWGGGYAWSQFKDEWAYGDAEHAWKIVKEINKKRDWFEPDCYERDGLDVSAGAPEGMFDVIPATASVEAMQRYEALIFVGWNTMTEEIYKKLVAYVKNGGKLFITAAHLNTNPARNGEKKYPNGGDLSELLGCKLTGKTTYTGLGHRFVSESAVPGMHYPFPNLQPADPIYSCGNVHYAETEVTDGTVCAMLSDSFLHNEAPLISTVIEHTLGKGHVVFFAAEDYAGNEAVYPLYRFLVREFIRAAGDTPRVLASSEVRYACYADDVIYLLNTSYDMPATAVIEPLSDKPETLLLAPMELRKIRVKGGKVETLATM